MSLPQPTATLKLQGTIVLVHPSQGKMLSNAELVIRVHQKREALQEALNEKSSSSKGLCNLLLRAAHTNRLWSDLTRTARSVANPIHWASSQVALPSSS
eukprot:m.364292 g.364292  ORF g.364292 m.364292 type:complete len:99 (+) comp26376_c0_seq1:1064-1360(+)